MICISCSEPFDPAPWEANVCPQCNPEQYATFAGLDADFVTRRPDKKAEQAQRKAQVTVCAWCPVPSRPSPEHHPNGQCSHVLR